jgi:small conductance mechanosensitive channel
VIQVVAGLVVLLLFLLLARFLRNLAARVLTRRRLHPEALLLATHTVYFSVIGVGAVIVVSIVLGSFTVGVAGVLVAALMTSLGFQDLIKNYVSGFYVLMERNVRVGDMVETGPGYRGVVTDVRMRVTYLRGAEGEMLVVPNSELFTKIVVVSQAPPGWGSNGEGPQHDSDETVEVPTG